MKITFIIAFMKIIASLVLCQPLYHSASNNYKSIDLSTSSFIPFPIAPFLRRPCYPLPHPLPTLEAPLHSHLPPFSTLPLSFSYLLQPPPLSMVPNEAKISQCHENACNPFFANQPKTYPTQPNQACQIHGRCWGVSCRLYGSWGRLGERVKIYNSQYNDKC